MLAAVMGLVAICAVSPAHAQPVEFGAKVGPSFGVLTADPEGEDYERRIAASGGGFLVLPVTGRIGVQIEALFSPKGAKLYAEDLGLTSTLLLDYLDLPVLARIGAESSAFHVFAGPYVGVRVRAKRQISASGGGITSGERTDMSAEVERFDWGMVAGAGMHRGQRLVIDGRYAWGLTDVNKDTNLGIRFRSRVLTILAGVRF